MKYIIIILCLIGCTKEKEAIKPINWSATEYRYVYDSPNQPFVNHIKTYISIHFHNLKPEELPQFRQAEAYGPYQMCGGDSTLSQWIVRVDTCK